MRTRQQRPATRVVCATFYGDRVWVLRELVRLLLRIGFAALIALVLAELWAIVSGGDLLRNFQIACYLIGASLLMLGVAGSEANERRMQLAQRYRGRQFGLPGLGGRPGDPALAPGAVFVGAAIVLLAIGYLV